MNRISKAKVKIEVLDEIASEVYSKIESIKTDYRVVGLKPKTEYDMNAHEYVTVYDKDGKPEMINDWQTVEKTEDELTDTDKAKLEILNSILWDLGELLNEV